MDAHLTRRVLTLAGMPSFHSGAQLPCPVARPPLPAQGLRASRYRPSRRPAHHSPPSWPRPPRSRALVPTRRYEFTRGFGCPSPAAAGGNALFGVVEEEDACVCVGNPVWCDQTVGATGKAGRGSLSFVRRESALRSGEARRALLGALGPAPGLRRPRGLPVAVGRYRGESGLEGPLGAVCSLATSLDARRGSCRSAHGVCSHQ